jgi:tetratricopeptide (TPR) repeat protein
MHKIIMMKYLVIFLALNNFLISAPRDYNQIVKLKETVEAEKFFSQGKYDEALDLFRETIEKGEQRGEPHFYIGSIFEIRRKYTESIPYFEEAVKRELPREFREAALWKLILLHRKEENYSEVLMYIDLLEEMKVSHSNLVKYREEAEISLSPEKIEARVLFKEGKRVISDWEKENPEENFWSSPESVEQRGDVLSKFEKAASMDNKLLYLYWEIVSIYEKSGDLENTARIYDIIIETSHSDEAYYKAGVLFKKRGNYQKSRQYFMGALENLKKENLKFFILINLSQTLYAVREFHEGLKFAEEAIAVREDTSDIFSPQKLMYCLHLARIDHRDKLEKNCSYTATESVLKKKDSRAATLYFFSAAETARVFSGNQDSAEHLKKISDYYTKALIPPSLRTTDFKRIVLYENIQEYEEGNWSPLPDWALLHLDNVLPVWENPEEAKNLYIFTSIYRKYLQIANEEKFSDYLLIAAHNAGKIDEAMDILKSKAIRTNSQEIMYLKLLAFKKNFSGFQDEMIEFLNKNPHETEFIKSALISEKILEEIPRDQWSNEFKKIWGEMETGEPQPESEPEIPVNGDFENTEKEND